MGGRFPPRFVLRNPGSGMVCEEKTWKRNLMPGGGTHLPYLLQPVGLQVRARSLERLFSSRIRWQYLYFFPLPHQQGSFRPRFGIGSFFSLRKSKNRNSSPSPSIMIQPDERTERSCWWPGGCFLAMIIQCYRNSFAGSNLSYLCRPSFRPSTVFRPDRGCTCGSDCRSWAPSDPQRSVRSRSRRSARVRPSPCSCGPDRIRAESTGCPGRCRP